MTHPHRRTLLTGLVGFVACAPAIVRAGSLMPVKAWIDTAPLGDSFQFNMQAVWDVALTADEMSALHAGVSPSLIRPDHLMQWAPEQNVVGRGYPVGMSEFRRPMWGPS